ncbi:hypothetical protein P7D22_21110 [Lichenihabitans sp. Uapishka_5]|uniref:hypothetical protein n=1 Tax=Lichenihabitans sp. Uapishka_5 TaxID=3037302 RepID=UPI0029E7FFF2|nr:hypothetical protein [Lichenihabitans sp. Uapishka_5]MDX7953668.1 hypothetical protein [Lichenihabitans sp. Uapishka_5]
MLVEQLELAIADIEESQGVWKRSQHRPHAMPAYPTAKAWLSAFDGGHTSREERHLVNREYLCISNHL